MSRKHTKRIDSRERRIAGLALHTVPGLRARWPEELARYTDREVAAAFDEYFFSSGVASEDRFSDWFPRMRGRAARETGRAA